MITPTMDQYQPACPSLFKPGVGLPGPAVLGRRMAALYRVWRDRATVDLAGLVARLLPPSAPPLAAACRAAARAVTEWRGLPYHSALHHAEVAVNVTVLAELAAGLGHPLTPRHRTLLLAASVAHDYRYRPGARFGAETVAADAMDAIGRDCGVAAVDRKDIVSLILATEPGVRSVLSGASPGGPLPPGLHDLTSRPDLLMLAATLSDADLLSSAGLTLRWHQVQHGRLQQELGRPIPRVEDLAFFDHLVGPEFLSVGGRHFTPNLRRIRAACAR